MIKLVSETDKLYEYPKDKLIKYTKYFSKYFKMVREQPDIIKKEKEFKFNIGDETLDTVLFFINKNCRVKIISVTEQLIIFADYLGFDNLKYEIYCQQMIYPIMPIFEQYLEENGKEMMQNVDSIDADDKDYFHYIYFDKGIIDDPSKIYKTWKYKKYATLTTEQKFNKLVNCAYCLVGIIRKYEIFLDNHEDMSSYYHQMDGEDDISLYNYLIEVGKYILSSIDEKELYDKLLEDRKKNIYIK